MKEIIKNHKRLIQSIIYKLTGSYNEDIEQEVYIKTWRNLDKYDEKGGKFKSWISVLTANLCRDYFRSKNFCRQDNISIDDEDFEYDISSDMPNAEEVLDTKMRQKIILKAVDSLPRKLRQIVILYEFHELSYEDIAKKTNLPLGTVKSRLSNARKILSKKLEFLKENRNE